MPHMSGRRWTLGRHIPLLAPCRSAALFFVADSGLVWTSSLSPWFGLRAKGVLPCRVSYPLESRTATHQCGFLFFFPRYILDVPKLEGAATVLAGHFLWNGADPAAPFSLGPIPASARLLVRPEIRSAVTQQSYLESLPCSSPLPTTHASLVSNFPLLLWDTPLPLFTVPSVSSCPLVYIPSVL